MSKNYTIAAVSEKVNNWSNDHGDFTTYNVRLEGEGDDAVQVNKKSTSPVPKVGDEIYGDLTSTEWGIKFKSASKPFGGNSSSRGSSENPETQDAIFRSVALEHAVVYSQRFSGVTSAKELKDLGVTATVEVADKFYEWLTGSQTRQNVTQADSQPARDWDSLNKGEKEDGIEGESIDLKDIPF